MSKVPSQVGKGIVKAAKKTGNVIAAPVRGGMLGHSQAVSRGSGTAGTIKKTAQGVAAGIAHPNLITKTAKLVGTKPTPGASVKPFVRKAGAPTPEVSVKIRKPAN
jgi:hypothetical protein